MMKTKMTADQSKKVSKKVQGLFDGTFISKVLTSASKKKQTNRKLKEFHVKQSVAASLASKVSPHKIEITRDFEQIQFVPVIELTHDQVDNLLKTASELHKQFAKFGAVKLRLPKDLEPASLNIENTKKKLTIRQQVLPLLPKGRTFVNIKEAYEYKEFFDYTQEIERDFVFETAPPNEPSHPLLRDEREYWGVVYGKIQKELREDEDGYTVEYAADLALDQFFEFDIEDRPKPGQRLSLSRLFCSEDSLFQITKTKTEAISGLVVPWVYIASKYATFCWHTEDLFLYSFNFMHSGGHKIWYTVPFEDVEKFRGFMLREYKTDLLKRPGLLDEVVLMFSPLALVKEGVVSAQQIRVFKIYQEPGDLILTFPGVYHSGFSPTFNVCEAVNVACPDWIPTAQKHLEMNSREGFPRKSCFSLEWMLAENRRKVDRLDFSKEASELLELHYKRMVEEEVKKRNDLRPQVCEEAVLVDRSLKFWDLLCVSCRQYAYLTCLGCRGCQKVWCSSCKPSCPCADPALVMFVRYTDNELVNC